jgi:hypothetical protein
MNMMERAKRRPEAERGAALVIAIFSLMLISVVATAMVLTAGTQSAIRSNYKSAMQAFYDAKAGLEEARGRLWTSNPDTAAVSTCAFPNPGGMPLGQVCYIVNASGNEVVNPLDLSAGNPYADFEYKDEWGSAVTSATGVQPFINSTSTAASGGIAGPLYKWVRITPRTEASGGLAISGGTQRASNLLYFDGAHQTSVGGPGTGAAQVLTITSLAVTPYGSRRMLQYTVAAPALSSALPTFPAAVTLDGNGFTSPSGNGTIGGSSNVQLNGNDGSAPSGTPSGVPAIGYTNSNDASAVTKAASPATNYSSPDNTPAVGVVSLPPLLQTPGGLDSLVQSITRGADLVLNPPSGTQADQNSLTLMSAANPMVVVVNGDFHLTHSSGKGAFTGYGLLLVTGTLYYDPDDSWNGIILVVGRGVFDGSQHGSNGQINGTVLVANTRDSSGNLLTSLGAPSFNLAGGGQGIHYNSQLVTNAEASMTYQVLSFREIAQTTP